MTTQQNDETGDEGRGRGPWWVRELLIPTVIVLVFLAVIGLAGGWIEGQP